MDTDNSLGAGLATIAAIAVIVGLAVVGYLVLVSSHKSYNNNVLPAYQLACIEQAPEYVAFVRVQWPGGRIDDKNWKCLGIHKESHLRYEYYPIMQQEYETMQQGVKVSVGGGDSR